MEQETAPWANADKLTFNDSRAAWTVLPNKSGAWPSDLLVLHQYGDCNGSSLYLFGLSSDGSRLINYSFINNGASPHPSLYAHTLEAAAADNDGFLWSRTYDNARGASYSILWSVDPIHQQLSGTSYGPDVIPQASDSHAANQSPLTLEDKLAIAKQLLQGFLQERQRTGVTDDRRIKDFHIKEIRLDSLQTAPVIGSGFQIYAQYEILPDSSSFVLAGNGEIRDDGWIMDVSRYMRVAESSGSYFIASMGTGP